MNERRTPTLCADNRFFSSSFHGFFREGMTVQRSGSGQIGVKSHVHSKPGHRVNERYRLLTEVTATTSV